MSIRNVFTVAKKEFFSAFWGLYAYLTVGITAIVGAIFLILGNLAYSSDSILSVLSNMSLVIALILPVTAVNSFAGKKKDTDALYDMMPLSAADVVVGKYLSALWQTLIPVLFMVVIYPLAASLYSQSFDMAVTYSSGVAFIFFCAALLAVYFFIACRAKSRVRAYIYCYTVAVVWYLAGIAVAALPLKPLVSFICFAAVALLLSLGLYLLLRRIWFAVGALVVLEGALSALYFLRPQTYVRAFETVCGKIAIFTCFDRFICGMFDIRTLIFFVLLSVTFVFLAVRWYSVRYNGKPQREGLRISSITSRAVVPLTLVLAILVGVAAAAIPSSAATFDTTQGKKNTVSATAKEYLSGLDEEVTIYLLEPTGLAPNYEMYLEELVSSSEKLTLKKVYYSNQPEFYSDRGISIESISANSLVIESADSMQYLSYMSLFTYTNETLGFSEISVTEYNYYYQMFASNSQYADYMSAIEYDTKMYFCADKVICSYIEYVTADVIPTQYALSGHGERGYGDSQSPYYGVPAFELLGGEIPADASSILINMPTSDISEDEKQALLSYLDRGGQITFVTDEKVFDMPNIMAVLSSYGMSAQRSFVKVDVEGEDGSVVESAEFVPVIETDNDILYALEGAKLSASVKNTNAIIRNATARENLLHFPLITVSETQSEEQTVTHILACAAEADTGARVVWFTGGDSFNNVENEAYAAVVYSLYWTSIQYTSNVPEMPSVMYQSTMSKVTSGSATAIGALFVIIPLAFMAVGGIMIYRRRKAR
ncbi:MAG: hypothetical protein E7653_05175 [Ruminococcaceae bacterium]|nr:hypothetical protein [Oscillospiraceae bacterium]